ncbi:MAG: EMC3/TMCO1 family protein [Nitrososphaerota archaeon]|nr:EMC3/TMCO1 family protein [Candidatus Calditenuaceae archaeon]MDW8072882.1 EMC3/TMCO1 family protein [Nitrososphaerota archaeon]
MVEVAVFEILGLSTFLALVSSGLRRVVLSKEDMLAMQEVSKYNRELMKALREKDKKAIERLEKKKEYMQKVQAKIFGKNMTLMLISLVIFFTFFFFANARYGHTPLLVMPPGLDLPFISSGGKMEFFGWYLLTFFSVSLPINKFLSVRITSQSAAKK